MLDRFLRLLGGELHVFHWRGSGKK